MGINELKDAAMFKEVADAAMTKISSLHYEETEKQFTLLDFMLNLSTLLKDKDTFDEAIKLLMANQPDPRFTKMESESKNETFKEVAKDVLAAILGLNFEDSERNLIKLGLIMNLNTLLKNEDNYRKSIRLLMANQPDPRFANREVNGSQEVRNTL